MAKMKVYDLARELEIQSKEIVAFLQEKGVAVKAPQSSIEDDAIAMVRGNFKKKKSAEKAETPKEEPKKAKTAAKKETAEPKTEKPEKEKVKKETETVKKEAPAEKAKPEEKPVKKDEPREKTGVETGKKEEPVHKKKKKIIFVSNPNNSKMPRGSRPPMSSGNRRPSGSSGYQGQPAGRHVQLGPNQMINKATGKVMEKLPPRREEPVEERETSGAPAQKTAAPRYLNNHTIVSGNQRNTSDRRNDSRSNSGDARKPHQDHSYAARTEGNQYGDRKPGSNKDYRSSHDGYKQNKGSYQNNNSHSGDSRYHNSNDRSQGRNARPDSRYRKNESSVPFMDEPLVKKDGKRDEQRRYNQNNKNKRSRKDAIYEEGEMNAKKAGRFIKPEKKEEPVEEIKVITLPEVLTIRELAEKMKVQPSVIVKKLFMQGQMVTVNQEISYEEAENIAIEYDIMCEKEVKVNVIEELLKEEEEDEKDMVKRAPVICVMGHVDHGKTSLLDAIRKTNVTDREAGGITQQIGAYTVKAKGQKITFLDTPGHEAFTAMRMRGANSTDIAILVVAADDGVMPQTIEAINHAKAAGIEIIVAVNKIDKPSANVERVKQELTEYGLISEDWGGNTVFVPVSAKTGEGIPELLDMVLLTADILELKANPNRKARGLVIEAELDKGRGPVATVLVQKGTLKVGDFISAGASHGKVRAMIDDKGKRVKEAGPSSPVEILGLSDVPNAGEVFIAHENDKMARSFAETFVSENKNKKLEETKSKMSLDDLFTQIQEGNLKELNLIIKADVQGSVEALKQSLEKLTNDEVVVKCIHGGVGAINESDVSLAAASNAIVIGFNVRVDAAAKDTAEHEGVDVRLYKVIYQAIEDVESAMKGMLDPVYEEKIIGHAEVRQLFKASAIGNIAGSYVLDGEFQKGCKVRITREGKQIYEGELASLKRFKDDVKEVKAGFECGLVFEGFDQMQEQDIVEAYIMVEVPRT